MPDNEEELLGAMKIRIKNEFGDLIEEKDLSDINSVNGAKYILGYLIEKRKNTAPEKEQKEESTNNLPKGGFVEIEENSVNDAEQEWAKRLNSNPDDRFQNMIRPARINNAILSNLRVNKGCRYLMVFTEEYPDGRMF